MCFLILLIQVDYLGFDVSPTSLPQWSILLFLLISIIYIHITPNTIYYAPVKGILIEKQFDGQNPHPAMTVAVRNPS